jgi:hypothetical protein
MTDTEIAINIVDITSKNAKLATENAQNAAMNSWNMKQDALTTIGVVGLQMMGIEMMMKNEEIMNKCVESSKNIMEDYGKNIANSSIMTHFTEHINTETEIANKNTEIVIKNVDILNDTSIFIKKIAEGMKEEVEQVKNSIEIATKRVEFLDANKSSRWEEYEHMMAEEITKEVKMKSISESKESLKDLVKAVKEEAKTTKKNATIARKNVAMANAISEFAKKIAEIVNDTELIDEDEDIAAAEVEIAQTILKFKNDAEVAKKIEGIGGEELDKAMKKVETFNKILFKNIEPVKYDDEKIAEIAKKVDFSAITQYMETNRK